MGTQGLWTVPEDALMPYSQWVKQHPTARGLQLTGEARDFGSGRMVGIGLGPRTPPTAVGVIILRWARANNSEGRGSE